MGAEAEQCRLCGSPDVVPYEHLDDASHPEPHERARPHLDDVALTPAQLDALASELVGWIELSPEGRKYLRTHVATERNPNNREFVLRLRGKNLTCDGCGVDLAAEYSSQHRRVVEVHHVRPLARGPRQAKGTADFNVLCPTCHRVVHYRREEPLNMAELRALLGR
jgi:predicted HNH restriction endonuclease